MPEGDTIHRAAANLRKVLDRQKIVSASGRREVLSVADLAEATVTGVEARGKHLLIHFDSDLVVHSHMGMTGSWHIYRLTDSWQKPDTQAVLVLKTAAWCVVCFTPKLLEIVSETKLRRNSWLTKLGPDILGPPISDDVFLSRMRSQSQHAIGEVLMNQSVVSGIGNVYRSEILHLEHIHPETLVAVLDDAALLSLRDRAVFLMKRNLNNGARTTRFRGEASRLWVYGRRGQPCLKCGTIILMQRQGDNARSTYFCPACQKRVSYV